MGIKGVGIFKALLIHSALYNSISTNPKNASVLKPLTTLFPSLLISCQSNKKEKKVTTLICISLLTLRRIIQFSSVQSLSRIQLFVTLWTAAHQASLSITNFWSFLKLMSIESIMPSNHLILCCPLLLLPPIPPSIRVFSNKSALHIRWPKDRSFSLSPSKEYSGKDYM